MKASIKTKIVLFIIALLLCVLICQIIFGVFLSRRTFVRKQKDQTESLFYQIKAGYADDNDTLYSITTQTQGLYNIQVEISDGTQRIYTTRNIPPRQREESYKLPYDESLYSEAPKAHLSSSAHAPEKGAPTIRLIGRFDYEGQARYVTLISPVEPIDASVTMFTQANAIIAFCVLFIGAIAAYFFAARLAKPVRDVEAVAKNVAELSFDKTADENISTSELYSLSVSVNSMAENLKRMIGELEDANRQLQKDVDYQKQLEKMRREFIANISHEMKTPLCMLMMYSENLKNNIAGIDREYYCDTIIEEASRLNDMVREMLELSSIENGLSQLHLVPLSLSELCQRLCEKASVLLAPNTVDVTIEPLLSVNGDMHYLEQAASNFIANAIAHTPLGGKIAISLSMDGKSSARFSVCNAGSAIPQSDLAHIWESFYQTDKARTQGEGMHVGLGLYIVKTVIDAHRGSCSVENRSDGVCFSFSLPLS